MPALAEIDLGTLTPDQAAAVGALRAEIGVLADRNAAQAPWRDDLRGVSGVLFVGNVSLGNQLRTRARLVKNPDRHLPESLAFPVAEQNLVELTGFQRQTQDAG